MRNKAYSKLIISTFSIAMLMLVASGLYATGYDLSKFSGLAKQRYGTDAYNTTLELDQLLSRLKSAPEADKLKEINSFFNRKISYAEDVDVWGQADYWATPLEALGLGAGDCEDFSIAKYTFLKILNVANDKLRLTYVRASLPSKGSSVIRAHMVLSYYSTPQSEPLILDSLVSDILPASRRKDLTPIFSFNDKGLWVGNSSKPRSDAVSHLSRWRDVLARIAADGIE